MQRLSGWFRKPEEGEPQQEDSADRGSPEEYLQPDDDDNKTAELSNSDSDSCDESVEQQPPPLPELADNLSKWTNYFHGWQDRYLIVKDHVLSYYKSEVEVNFGCRGAIRLERAVITPHQFDECRFDVTVNESVWYLRASCEQTRTQWVDVLQRHRLAESGFGSQPSLVRHPSLVSLTSAASTSIASRRSFQNGHNLIEKLHELDEFKGILGKQIETLTSYFEACASATNLFQEMNAAGEGSGAPQTFGAAQKDFKDIMSIFHQHGAHAIDFNGEAMTFKATTTGVVATLSHCIDMFHQNEEHWRRRLDKERDRSRRLKAKVDEQVAQSAASADIKISVVGSPDFEEGPHAKVSADIWYDAMDAYSEMMDQDQYIAQRRREMAHHSSPQVPETSLDPVHELYNPINRLVEEHIQHAGFGNIDTEGWDLLAEDGHMKVYRKEFVRDGIVLDPLKAVHQIQGVTAHELCHYFYDPGCRMEWEGTIVECKVLETLAHDTIIQYQLHKKVWLTAQRDTLYWSHIRHVSKDPQHDYWIVVNHSTDHPAGPPLGDKVRAVFTIAMIGETTVEPCAPGESLGRKHITTQICYIAKVDPGGFVPATALRYAYKLEYPRFLRRFTQYVTEQTRDKKILW